MIDYIPSAVLHILMNCFYNWQFAYLNPLLTLLARPGLFELPSSIVSESSPGELGKHTQTQALPCFTKPGALHSLTSR